VDETNAVIDRSRDLRTLKGRHGASAGRNFQQLAREARLHEGCRAWSFGALPETFSGMHDGQRIHGHVALADEGESVAVRVFATLQEADASHPRGVSRLIRLVLARDLKPLLKDLAVNVAGELAYRQLTRDRKLREDVLDLVVRAVFVEGQPPLREQPAFDARLATRRGGIGLPAQEISRAVQSMLEGWAAIQAKLKACRIPGLKADIEQQVGRLMPADVLGTTPWARLREFPRYLKAILHRLDKAPLDPVKDAKLQKEVEAFEVRYWQAAAAVDTTYAPVDDAFRWLLEEYRVSLFAQQLKTPVPVSAKRLTDAWQDRQPLKR
jgi:ATP-dependent helicase HrpA